MINEDEKAQVAAEELVLKFKNNVTLININAKSGALICIEKMIDQAKMVEGLNDQIEFLEKVKEKIIKL